MAYKIANITGGELEINGGTLQPQNEEGDKQTIAAANAVSVAKREDVREAVMVGNIVIEQQGGSTLTGDDARRFLEDVADGNILCVDPE